MGPLCYWKRAMLFVSRGEEIRDAIREQYPDDKFCFWDGLDDAIIGVAESCSKPPLLLYDRQLCVDVFMRDDGMSNEEAEEWIDFNVLGDWVGEQTPMILDRLVKEGEES